MNTPTTGAQIAHEKIDRYRSFGAFGKPAWQSHVQLRAMLKAKLGDRYANYFAKPTYDADAGELRWTAEVAGSARGWHEMSAEEQAGHALDMEDIRSRLIGFAAELREKGGGQPGGAAAFASLLEQATKVPQDGNFLYFVGEQPVIAFWGFENQGGGSVDPTVQTPRFTAAAPAAPTFAAAPPAAGTAGAVVSKKKRPWWWWLLLALLLLLLLLALLRGCTPEGGFDLRRAVPGMAPAEDKAPPASEGRASDPGAIAGMGPGGPGGAVDGGGAQNPAALPGADPTLPAASQPDMGQPAPPAASMPGADAPQPKQEPPVPAEEPKKDPTTDPKQDPKQDPKSEAKNDPKAKADKALTDPPKPGEDAKAMQLPKDPKAADKLDFLQGDWKAGEGLADPNTKQPLDLSVQFGKDGKGEITLRRPDGTVCSGGVQGQMRGGKLAIEGNQAIPCSGGGSYAAPKIECGNSSSGQTECRGINKDGTRYNMEMRRK
jgi:hypothetical protein